MTGPSQLEFATVYRENFGRLAAFFARRCRDPQQVADLTSQTFVEAISSAHTYRGRGTPAAWLIAIARRVYAQHLASETAGAGVIDQLGGQLNLADDEVEDLAERIDAQRDGKELLEQAASHPMHSACGSSAPTADYERTPTMTAFEDGLWTRLVEEHHADRVALHTASEASSKQTQFATHRSRWLAAAAATIIAVPGIAYAAGAFTSAQTAAKTLPGSERIFGSTPTCTVVQPNVEYRCTLAKAPAPDPVNHLTPRQWNKLLDVKVPGPHKVLWNRPRATYPHGYSIIKPWQLRAWRLGQDRVLASFGFTPAQIQAHNEAIAADAAGIGAGQFKGTLEPTIDATHHINGGCRATNADGTQWDCYLGHAAVKQKIVPGIGAYAPGPGVG